MKAPNLKNPDIQFAIGFGLIVSAVLAPFGFAAAGIIASVGSAIVYSSGYHKWEAKAKSSLAEYEREEAAKRATIDA